MNFKLLKNFGVFVILLSFGACTTISLTPQGIHQTLPTLTQSRYMLQTEADAAVLSNGCKYIVKDRKYSPISGLNASIDLKRAARGIDEWVELDGGNAYVLTSYKWVKAAKDTRDQLHVEFDTLLCR